MDAPLHGLRRSAVAPLIDAGHSPERQLTFGIIAALLALAGGLIYRSRLHAGGGRGAITDDMIRRIEEDGIVQFGDDDDEPLDLRTIREEEERFLNETWDEPDEP